ncbi:carbohydrate ABC transporter permease [Tabrizicola sp. YIM 78059]|uniref:carbohydrate ABC transporter permease n=1 Tax=Tabrizicola sp. YIM 78059 TaxID=2529861 RepID=UPI0010AA9AA4|nr:sugar ABC transporter permease [Tabrizicola sp. YIM 78059]
MHPALQGLITIVVGVGGCVAYYYFSNLFLDKVLFPARGPQAGRNINRANMIRPWLFLAPALIALGLYLAYPVFATLHLSLTQRVTGGGYDFVGLDNYAKMGAEPKFWEALQNNMLWLIVVPAASTAFGLLAAQLSDRIRWGNIAKSLIFMPMAISFVGAAVIWKLVYDTRPEGQDQIGVMNAVWLAFEEGSIWSFVFLKAVPVLLVAGFALAVVWIAWVLARPVVRRSGPVSTGRTVAAALGALVALWLAYESLRGIIGIAMADLPYGQPQTWLTMPFWNNFFLMAVLVWIQTGFAMVILSAALRGVPEDTIEAAIVDGANPFQIFFQIKVPQIMGTIVVVWTTITIVVLKVFDIVYAMTNGQWQTQVLANYMYDKLFRANDWGVGSAAAMVIMLLVTPILVWNVYNARKEMR